MNAGSQGTGYYVSLPVSHYRADVIKLSSAFLKAHALSFSHLPFFYLHISVRKLTDKYKMSIDVHFALLLKLFTKVFNVLHNE